MFALSDAEVALVGKAFDRAWDGFLRTGALTPENLWASRNALAARILRAVYYGERDEWRLARDAVSYLRQVTVAAADQPKRQTGPDQRRQRSGRKAPPRRPGSGLSLGESCAISMAEHTVAAQIDSSVSDPSDMSSRPAAHHMPVESEPNSTDHALGG